MSQGNYFKKKFGELISTLRLERGLTQKDLGKKMGYHDASAGQVVHKIEEGKISVPKKKIKILLDTLGINHEKLGLDPTISLPLWIASQGKKGGSFSWKELSETVASGMEELSEKMAEGASNLAAAGVRGEKRMKLTKKIMMKYTVEGISEDEMLELLEAIYHSDQSRITQLRKLLGLETKDSKIQLGGKK